MKDEQKEVKEEQVSLGEFLLKAGARIVELEEIISQLIPIAESERGFYISDDECGLLEHEYNQIKQVIERAKLKLTAKENTSDGSDNCHDF